MPTSCCAFGCTNHNYKRKCRERKVSFHLFPKDEQIKKRWILNLKLGNLRPSHSTRICSEHFQEECFSYQNFTNKRMLKKDAVPTKFAFGKVEPHPERTSYAFGTLAHTENASRGSKALLYKEMEKDATETPSRTSRTPTVNIDHNRFSLDGVIAEMIIEVDEDEHPSKTEFEQRPVGRIQSPVFTLGSPNSSKHSFVHTLGLNSINDDDESHKNHNSDVPVENCISDDEVLDENENTAEIVSENETSELLASSSESNTDPIVDDETAVEPEVQNESVGSKKKLSLHGSKVVLETLPKDIKKTLSKDIKKVSIQSRKFKRRNRWNKGIIATKTKSKVVRNEIANAVKKAKKVTTKASEGRKSRSSGVLVKDEEFTPSRMSLRNKALRVFIPDERPLIRNVPKVEFVNDITPGNGVKLGSIGKICDNIRGAENYGLRPLFRILYYQWPSDDINDVIYQILQFSGFPFQDNSVEFTKRKKIIINFNVKTLEYICNIFGIVPGTKSAMIQNILKYLRKPTRVLDPSMDKDFQPVVLLHRVDTTLEKARFPKLEVEEVEDIERQHVEAVPIPQVKKRGRPKKTQVVSAEKKPTKVQAIYSNMKQKKLQTIYSSTKQKKLHAVYSRGRPKKVITVPPKGRPKEKTSLHLKLKQKKTITVSSDEESRDMELDAASSEESEMTELKEVKKMSVKAAGKVTVPKKLFIHKKLTSPSKVNVGQKRKHIRRSQAELLIQSRDDSEESLESRNSVKEKPQKQQTGVARRSPNKRRKPDHFGEWEVDSPSVATPDEGEQLVDFTLSDDSEEDNYVPPGIHRSSDTDTAESGLSDSEVTQNTDFKMKQGGSFGSSSKTPSKLPQADKAKIEIRCKGVKLTNFYQIRRSVNAAEKGVLQRLHVILYGTSDEPDVMRKNILNFNGFDFDKDSEEWNSKKFLLSLVATNMVREYIDLLHIHIEDDNPDTMIDDLMNFLMTPRSVLLNKESFVSQKKEKAAPKPPKEVSKGITPKAPTPKAPTKVKEKLKKDESKKVGPRRRKVLMDEATVRKLELELAREQRARKRAELDQMNFLKPDYTQKPVAAVAPEFRFKSADNPPPVGTAKLLNPLKLQPQVSKVKLGDHSHVKFMIVALDYSDLDVIHNLIFLHDGVKSKIRRNILDFDGFDFDRSSIKYEVRRNLLKKMGYTVVKRIAFVFGLAPLNTDFQLDRLCDRIMSFLISPREFKDSASIREFPQTFFQDFPRDFNKKEVFSGIPQFARVLSDEFATSSNRPLKNVNDVLKKDIQKMKNSLMPSSSLGIPIAEVITSDVVKINGVPHCVSTNNTPMRQKTIVPTSRKSGSVQLKSTGASAKVVHSFDNQLRIINPSLPKDFPFDSNSSQVESNLPANQTLIPLLLSSSPSSPPRFIFLSQPQQVPSQFTSPQQQPLRFLSPPSLVAVTSPQQSALLQPSRSILIGSPKQQSAQFQSPSSSVLSISSPPQQQSIRPVQTVTTISQSPVTKTTVASNPLLSRIQANVKDLVKSSPRNPHPTPETESEQNQSESLDTAKGSLNMSQLQKLPPPKSHAEEIVFHQKKADGEPQKLTLLRLPEGHPLLSSLEAGTLRGPIQISPVRHTIPKTVTSLLKSDIQHAGMRQIIPNTSKNIVREEPMDDPEEITLEDEDDDDKEETHGEESSLSENPDVSGLSENPEDEELFEKIRDIIHEGDDEELTVRKITEQLVMEYPGLDVTYRRDFIKSAIMNIICGMTSSPST